MTLAIFLGLVAFTLGLSTYLGRRAKTASGYFAAHGEVGWFVNGVAFAGDYLSAASFLGICGMIAFYGYDGFLYSIGFLAGWVVALFVIAEPIKKLGRFTFADALSAKFGNSRGITLAAAISTLVVSVFYLIPQMVGAGSLIYPLLGLAHHWGVIIVGALVITIVTTAGMVSTTWVQFIKGSMLVVFCAILVVLILNRGIRSAPMPKRERATIYSNPTLTFTDAAAEAKMGVDPSAVSVGEPLGPAAFIKRLSGMEIVRSIKAANHPNKEVLLAANSDGNRLEPLMTSGREHLLPGGYFAGIRSPKFFDRLDFASLMLALFCGTAALPHILIRYYTVKDAAAARKSTVVGIIAIGFFYVLTLYIGLGAAVSGNLNPLDINSAAPKLAETFGRLPFAIISAIAFTTVLGTVSGLILAAAGAIARDLMGTVMRLERTDRQQVVAAKFASVGVGVIAIVLGILFKNFSAAFLVGWAFNVAASANLPAIVMILFWNRTTKQGVVASILVGLLSSLAWLALTKEAMINIYGIKGATGLVPLSQPGLVTIPLAFLTLVAVSLATRHAASRERSAHSA